MRLLIDTQIFIWATQDNTRLSSQAKEIILAATEVFVSAVSIWEISIKSKLGKIKADPKRMIKAIQESGFYELPVTSIHAAGVELLPDHHRDPFDRLLLAQSLAEPLRLLTADAQLPKYSDLVILV
jgi:PIN domain nuclease of toxin-antitoxin system